MFVSKWEDELNQSQLRAVTHWGSPLLVLAGAGSGKTRVLTYRTAWLIEEKGVRAEKIVLLTFTNKAAGEMKERITELAGKKEGGRMDLGFAGTFHTFCARMLRKYGRKLEIEPGFLIYDTKDQESVIKSLGEKMDIATGNGQARKILGFISKMKNELYTPEAVSTWIKGDYQKKLIEVWKEYEKLLKKSQALDFDDLLVNGVRLLRDNELRKKINQEYGWVLVDEYQDTNKAQFELSKLLVEKEDQLTVVGDVAQAIYSFRGADFRNLDLLKKYFKKLSVVELDQNYRSTQKILDAAYEMLKNNTKHPVFRLESAGEIGGRLEVVETGDEREEAREVVGRCEEALRKEQTVAILYRTNAQSRSFEEELIKRGVAYRLVGGIRFYDRAEIKDLTAYLRLIYNKEDMVSQKRVEKIGKRRASKFWQWCEEQKEIKKKEPVVLIEGILTASGYLEKFKEENEKDRARLENIDEFLAVASEHKTLEEFLENIALIQADELADKKDSNNSKVELMTVHSAKGLEFDEVWIVGMEEGLFPHSRSLGEKSEMEEERRLLYVAITRARKGVGLSYVRSRLMYGGRSSQMVSRFLKEIPEELVTKIVRGRSKAKKNWSRNKKGDWEGEVKLAKKWEEEWGDGKKRIVQDWEIEVETKDDFDEIDSW